MPNHIIKKQGEGYHMLYAEAWCGEKISRYDWAFQDAQHAALSHDGAILACYDCVTEIIKCLNQVSEDTEDREHG